MMNTSKVNYVFLVEGLFTENMNAPQDTCDTLRRKSNADGEEEQWVGERVRGRVRAVVQQLYTRNQATRFGANHTHLTTHLGG